MTTPLHVECLYALLQQLHASLDIILSLTLHEALDRLLRLGRSDNIEPLGLGSCIVCRDDLDLVATLNLGCDWFQLVVNFGSDGTVTNLRVDVISKVERGRSIRHLARFTLWCKHHNLCHIQG